MAELTIQSITWSVEHGHPAIALGTMDSSWVFWISLFPEDAQAMATQACPECSRHTRLYNLVQNTLAHFGSSIRDIWFRFAGNRTIEAYLSVDGQGGAHMLPVHVVDGIIIAWHNQYPIHIDDGDLARIQELFPAPSQHVNSNRGTDDLDNSTPEAFRNFIESLDLRSFDNGTDG